jgi:hypothetical protein
MGTDAVFAATLARGPRRPHGGPAAPLRDLDQVEDLRAALAASGLDRGPATRAVTAEPLAAPPPATAS